MDARGELVARHVEDNESVIALGIHAHLIYFAAVFGLHRFCWVLFG